MKRADVLLVQHGLAPSRTVAQAWIAQGRVRWGVAGAAQPVSKASQLLPEDCVWQLEPDAQDRYVSRGALKLAGALRHAGVDPAGKLVLDVGTSTGGFAQCLLEQGAERVIGVEVGHDQLAAVLRAESRLTLLEGVNARHLTHAMLEPLLGARCFDLVVGDVSFISLTKILPALAPLLAPDGELLHLVKPQFEVGRSGLGKGGVVRDPAWYPRVEQTMRDACQQLGLRVCDYFPSELLGGDGNHEFFIHARRPGVPPDAVCGA